MMKILRSSIFRAICAIIVGALLIKYPDKTVKGLTISIGILFLLPGIFSVVTYVIARHQKENTYKVSDDQQVKEDIPAFPIVGLGSIMLGLILALIPDIFVTYLMYVLGAVMVLGGISQYMTLISLRKIGVVEWGFYVVPSLILLMGLFIIFYPMISVAVPMVVIGCSFIVYGMMEMVNAFKYHSVHKKYSQQVSSTDTVDIS
jgi:uncharacterized membrane protein HdeD (DUF308 family)